MKKETVHSTIQGWISSCRTVEQVAVCHETVIKLYDEQYNEHNTEQSTQLHRACINKANEIKNTNHTDCDSALEEI